MSKWVHADVLDFGINRIKTECDKVILIGAYTPGDSYAAVTTTILAEVAGLVDADFTLGSSGNNRTLTFASGKQDASANNSGGGATMHIAFLDTVNSKVLWVTEETSDQAIVAGNPVTFPALVYTSNQPT